MSKEFFEKVKEIFNRAEYTRDKIIVKFGVEIVESSGYYGLYTQSGFDMCNFLLASTNNEEELLDILKSLRKTELNLFKQQTKD